MGRKQHPHPHPYTYFMTMIKGIGEQPTEVRFFENTIWARLSCILLIYLPTTLQILAWFILLVANASGC